MKEIILGGWQIKHLIEPLTTKKVVVTQQYHEGQLCSVDEATRGNRCDGVVIGRRDAGAGIQTADCLPLVIITLQYAYALHISRKTLLTPLVPRVLTHLGTHVITGIFIGPHICGEHLVYEYEGEEIAAFKKAFPNAYKGVPEGTALSLRAALDGLLKPVITQTTPVTVDDRCTYEDNQLPSYRRWLENGKPGELLELFTMVSAWPPRGQHTATDTPE